MFSCAYSPISNASLIWDSRYMWFQDLLFLACSNSENRSSLTSMPEWPEWLLEVLISNFEVTQTFLNLPIFANVQKIFSIRKCLYMYVYTIFMLLLLILCPRLWCTLVFWVCYLLQMGSNKDSDGVSIVEIEDLIHNFLIIMLEHSMRRKDGWKVCFLLIVPKYYDV